MWLFLFVFRSFHRTVFMFEFSWDPWTINHKQERTLCPLLAFKECKEIKQERRKREQIMMNDTSLSAADLLELHSLLRLFLNDSMNKVDPIPSKTIVHQCLYSSMIAWTRMNRPFKIPISSWSLVSSGNLVLFWIPQLYRDWFTVYYNHSINI